MDITHALDLFGTAVFAYTGANAAKRHNFHVIGVLYIAVLSAVGGGTLRTLLMQEPTLFWMSSPDYMLVVLLVVLYSYLPTGQLNTQKFYFYVLDAFALAVFISIGFTFTIAHNQPTHIAFTMGILTGIGGGLIRDAITSQHPQALSDPIYPLIIIAGSIGCIISGNLDWAPWTISVPVVIAAVFGSQLFFRLTGKKEFEAPEALHYAKQTDLKRRFRNAQNASYMGLKALMVLSLTGTGAYLAYGNTVGIDTLYARLSLNTNNHNPQQTSNKPGNIRLKTTHPQILGLVHPPLPMVRTVSAKKDTISSIHRSKNKSYEINKSDLYPQTNSLDLESTNNPTASAQADRSTPQVVIQEVSRRIEKPVNAISPPLPTRMISKTPVHDTNGSDNSAVEVIYAQEQFAALAKAVKLRNINALDALTTGDKNKTEIFTSLFDKYIEINTVINNFEYSDNPKLYSATLNLESMRLPNGNLTLPPSSYGEIKINIKHTGDGWSRIQW